MSQTLWRIALLTLVSGRGRLVIGPLSRLEFPVLHLNAYSLMLVGFTDPKLLLLLPFSYPIMQNTAHIIKSILAIIYTGRTDLNCTNYIGRVKVLII